MSGWTWAGADEPRVAQARAADDPAALSVTFVARSCDKYSDVMANKARNNIQESLRDLGPDSNYERSEAVSVAREAAGTPAPPCKPLPGWTFSTGTGITGKSAATLQLSTASGAIRQDITTADRTPELDAQGQDTGRTLEGAVTVPLTADEIAAANRGSLVVQGGTPAQPLNGLQEQYGFAALRCAQDALNGDNVEYVSFPQGARHVFCYYYAITPPPSAGTITVVKNVAAGSPGTGDFRFDGNVSYADTNGDGVNDFVLRASAAQGSSATFIRGATGADDPPWEFHEVVPPDSGWLPPSQPVCSARNEDGGAGTSAIETDSTGKASIRLAAGDTVTCTYTNARASGTALLEKESIGGTGTFDIDLATPPGAPPVNVAPATTTAEGVPVTVAQAPDGVVAGTYTVTEAAPPSDGTGTWMLTGADCNGTALPIGPAPNGGWTVSYDVVQAEPVRCLLTNTFTPGGSVDVEKVTQGGTGSFRYTVTPHPAERVPGPNDATTYQGTATTTAEGVAATAVRDDGAAEPLADHLRVSARDVYTVQEFLPPTTDAGTWSVTSADCGGTEIGPLDRETASIIVRPTREHPHVVCRFTNTFRPSGSLVVVKTTSGDTDLRPNAAVVRLDCAGGVTADLTLVPGATTGTLPRRVFQDATACTVAEPATGAADGVDTTTNAVIAVAPDTTGRALALGETFTVEPGQAVTVTITNTLRRPLPPTSPPPTSKPPTSKPPTSHPPTSKPPTSHPPTSRPPTSEPPTSKPPTSQPPTSQPPTWRPPTWHPPTSRPPTSEPPTPQPPTSRPPTSGPPTSGPPTSEPPTSAPPTAGHTTSAPPHPGGWPGGPHHPDHPDGPGQPDHPGPDAPQDGPTAMAPTGASGLRQLGIAALCLLAVGGLTLFAVRKRS
ncbi:prealbumin-like fold domain-containing protein [Yinghuangia aomiensis]|uniref:prealbumin-like fold domain-containing protein n=1 Tax=Yinghuangia aomiensis TaxID=676205 RepID=UPI0031EDAECD